MGSDVISKYKSLTPIHKSLTPIHRRKSGEEIANLKLIKPSDSKQKRLTTISYVNK